MVSVEALTQAILHNFIFLLHFKTFTDICLYTGECVYYKLFISLILGGKALEPWNLR
jgi:hypothetical protein